MHEYQNQVRYFLRDEIRRHRRKRKLTQERMAEELRISARSYAYLEKGTYGCSAATLMFFLLILTEEEVLALRMEFGVLTGRERCMYIYEEEPSMKTICDTLRQLGITSNYRGYRYAALGVWLSAREPERLLLATKWLYPEVAAHYHTTWGAVERGIRTVIAIAWRQNPELLCWLAKHRLTEKPRTGQFLSILSTGLFPGLN